MAKYPLTCICNFVFFVIVFSGKRQKSPLAPLVIILLHHYRITKTCEMTPSTADSLSSRICTKGAPAGGKSGACRAFFMQNICIYQILLLPLHPNSE